MTRRPEPMHVLVAGGGVAGLEALLALSALAEGLVDVELLAPTDEFVYRPLLVAEPFGTGEALRVGLARVVEEAGARHTMDALASVDPVARTVETVGGAWIPYDALLLALGAKPVEAVPGALSFGDAAERGRFGELLATLGHRGMQRLAFVVPRQASWTIAAYELALLTAAEREVRRLSDVELAVVTHEAAPLDLLGPAASQLVAARLEEARITLRTSGVAERFEEGRLHLATGETIAADSAVALPALEVPEIPGLPQRQGGFVQTDNRMHVTGLNSVWAAGDATWFPIKQGGLATQQSDVAARAIAARAGAHVPIEAFQPMLRAELITGDTPAFLRASLPAGRGGEAASTGGSLWSPSTKVAGRYLGPFVARALGEEHPDGELADLEPGADPAAAAGERERAIELVLAAADADASAGDFEGALRWLSFVEQLNLVIPAAYVTRRDEWRRRLHPGLPPGAAAKRLDPTFAGPEAAISDLQRRVGWLREIRSRTSAEMGEQLSELDRDIDHLVSLSRRARILR